MDINPVQVVITVVALMALMTPLLLWSYQMGRGAGVSGKTPRFDRVVADVRLNDTWWRVEFDADDTDAAPQIVTLHLRQVGARVFGEGHSLDNRLHSFEGLLLGRRLCYVAVDDDPRSERSGAVLAEVSPGENQIVGIRSRWGSPAQGMAMRKAVFQRVNVAAADS
jgi:hypothetical protein